MVALGGKKHEISALQREEQLVLNGTKKIHMNSLNA